MSTSAGGGDVSEGSGPPGGQREVSGRVLVAILLGGVALLTAIALYLVLQGRA